jgi:oligoribonuclease
MPFFWIDLEMTGLDEKTDRILEAAAVVTDHEFQTLEKMECVIFQPPEILEGMNAWCRKHHGESGLTELVKTGIPLEQAEQQLIALADRHFKKNDPVVLCGNSVGNDRRFIDAWMPTFAKRLHYRLIDVSSLKEIFRTKYGFKYEKENKHRALDDIYESIEELKIYLNYVTPPASKSPAK